MSKELIIALFPLGIAALPGEPIPLHIFEPRYRSMFAYCSRKNPSGEPLPFGIVLSQSETLAKVGCTMQIAGTLKKFDDGRLLILTLGENRYRLVEILEEKDFPQARVEMVKDIEEEPNFFMQEEAKDLYVGLLQPESGATVMLPSFSPQLSFQLASGLDLSQGERQELLMISSENQRLKRLIAWMSSRIDAEREFSPYNDQVIH